MREIKTVKGLIAKLNRDRQEIDNRIRIYSEQNLKREVEYLHLQRDIIQPVIWDLEEVEAAMNIGVKVNLELLK